MALVAVVQVVHPGERRAAIALRWSHPILLAPVLGAFLQILIFRQAPSVVWPLLVLVAAVATRILRTRAVVTERAASLGVDGLALEERFVAAREIASVEQKDEAVWLTTKSGERLELRVESGELERARSTLAALLRVAAAPSSDAAGERFLADGPSSLEPRPSNAAAYREPAFDAERCIALAEDAATATHVRIAAADLLAEMGGTDDATRARIAAVAETTASPDLREALQAALDPTACTRA